MNRKILIFFCVLLFYNTIYSQVDTNKRIIFNDELINNDVLWANKVVSFSSEYSAKQKSSKQAIGIPNAMTDGVSSPCAWARKENNSSKREYIRVSFSNLIKPKQIVIAENYKPGAIEKITVYGFKKREQIIVYEGTAKQIKKTCRMFNVFFEETPFYVAEAEIIINSHVINDFEIDAIGISASTDTIKAIINIPSNVKYLVEKESLGPNINTTYNETAPVISANGNQLYFVRKFHPENIGGKKDEDDIWYSKFENNDWSYAVNIGKPLNNSYNNYIQSISPDGNALLLGNVYVKDGYNSISTSGVSISNKTKEGWAFPVEQRIKDLKNNFNGANYSLSPNGKYLLMAIESDDTYGGIDLYLSFNTGDNSWSKPMNLGSDVNTAAHDYSPFLTADCKTLYYSTSGISGFGKGDIFVTRRLDDTWQRWSEPVNMGQPINSSGSDFWFTIPASGDYAYFVSDNGSVGKNDIFRILLPDTLRPMLVDINELISTLNNNRSDSLSYDNTNNLTTPENDSGIAKEAYRNKGHSASVMAVALSSDNNFLYTASEDKSVKQWNITNCSVINTYEGHTLQVNSIDISSDNKYLVSGSSDSTIIIWDAHNSSLLKQFKAHKASVTTLCIMPNNKYIVSGSVDKEIKIWDFNTLKEIRTLKGHSLPIKSLCSTTDSKYIISVSEDKTIRIWDVADGREIKKIFGHNQGINSVCLSPAENIFATASNDGTIKLWTFPEGKELKTLRGHSDWVNTICFSHDGKFLLSAGEESNVKLWNVSSGKEIKTFNGHAGSVNSVNFFSDGVYFITGSSDNTSKKWHIKDDEKVRTFHRKFNETSPCKYTPDGKYIMFFTDSNTIKLFDIAKRNEVKTYKFIGKKIKSFSLSPHDGKTFLTAHNDSIITLWDRVKGSEIKSFFLNNQNIKSLCFSPVNKNIFAISSGRNVVVYNMKKINDTIMLSGYNEVDYFNLSPDGKLMVCATSDTTITIWNVDQRKIISEIKGHKDIIKTVIFSSDGNSILSASADKTIKKWDTQGNLIKTYIGHKDQVNSLCFSPDNKTFVSASDDKAILLWENKTGKIIKKYSGHSGSVIQLDFSPNGKNFISSSTDKSIKIWSVDVPEDVITIEGSPPVLDVKSTKTFQNKNELTSISDLSKGRYFLAGSLEQSISLWDIKSKNINKTYTIPGAMINSVNFLTDNKYFISSSSDSTIRIWDTSSVNEIWKMKYYDYINSICVSPDSNCFLTISGDSIAIWDLVTGKAVNVFKAHKETVLTACFSSDGKYILTGGGDKTVKLWNTFTGECLKSFFVDHQVNRICFTNDNSGFLIACNSERGVELWDLKSLDIKQKSFIGHKNEVNSICLSPNGKYMASCSVDKTIKLWDYISGKELYTFSGHSNGVFNVKFFSDSRYILSASNDNSIKIWDINVIFKRKRSFNRHGTINYSNECNETINAVYDNFEMKKYDESISLLANLYNKTSSEDNKSLVPEICYLLAKNYEALDSVNKAIKYYKECIDTLNVTGNSKFVWVPLYNLGSAYKKLGKNDSSLYYVKKSIQIIEDLSLNRDATDSTYYYDNQISDQPYIYDLAINYLIDNNENDTSWLYLEKKNLQTLTNLRGGVLLDNNTDELYANERILFNMKDSLYNLLVEEKSKPSVLQDSAIISKITNLKTIAEDDYLHFLDTVSDPDFRKYIGININPKDFIRIKDGIPQGTIIIEYVLTDSVIYIFSVTKDTVLVTVKEFDKIQLYDNIFNLLKMLVERKDIKRLNKTILDISETLIFPIDKYLKDMNRIVFIQTEELNKIPFQVLKFNDEKNQKMKYLIEGYSIYYMNSFVPCNRSQCDKSKKRVLAMGNPDGSLPSAEKEVNDLKKYFKASDVLINDKAKESKVKNISADYNVLHFATHGVMNFVNLKESYLLLAPDVKNEEDGRLTIQEIKKIPKLKCVDLVTLSACNTALPEETFKGWIINPASAFLDVGVKSVVATLWSVDDAATCDLMNSFYNSLKKQNTPDALRNAQIQLIQSKKYSHPFFWAPFILLESDFIGN